MSIQPKVIALGFFDGVHLGHGALLRRTVEEAKRRGVRSAVFTWAQPPKEVVTGVPVPLINSPEDRAWLAKSPPSEAPQRRFFHRPAKPNDTSLPLRHQRSFDSRSDFYWSSAPPGSSSMDTDRTSPLG